MRIGLTFTARSADRPDSHVAANQLNVSAELDDAEEEFDSPETIRGLSEALESLGHKVELLGDGEAAMRRLLDGPRPDLVFNIAEGRGISRCREAWLPAALEMLGVPCTGSDAMTLCVTLDKDCAKRLVQTHGVMTPQWVLIEDDLNTLDRELHRLSFPVIVKPACEGSSKGIFSGNLVHAPDVLRETVARLRQAYQQPILVEEFIDGDELTVGIVGNSPPEVLGIMRVVPNNTAGPFVYSLEVKRDWQRQVSYECPAQISTQAADAVREAALASWRALGCRDVARVDFRLRDGVPYFLEVNPLPGLSSAYSDLVLLARHLRIEYPELVGRIVQAAWDRTQSQTIAAAAV